MWAAVLSCTSTSSSLAAAPASAAHGPAPTPSASPCLSPSRLPPRTRALPLPPARRANVHSRTLAASASPTTPEAGRVCLCSWNPTLLRIWCLRRWTRPAPQRIRPCGFPSFLFAVTCAMEAFHACRAAASAFGTIKHSELSLPLEIAYQTFLQFGTASLSPLQPLPAWGSFSY